MNLPFLLYARGFGAPSLLQKTQVSNMAGTAEDTTALSIIAQTLWPPTNTVNSVASMGLESMNQRGTHG